MRSTFRETVSQYRCVSGICEPIDVIRATDLKEKGNWQTKCTLEDAKSDSRRKRGGWLWLNCAMRIAFIAVTALILLGTGAAAQEISNDYSKADFAHFKTYAWASGHSVADESLNQSIVSSIDGQLSAKGLTKVSPGEDPDVLVSYDVVFDRDIRGMGFRNGLRNLRWRSGSKYVLDPRRPFSQIAVAQANRKGEHHSTAAVTFMGWRIRTKGPRRISVRRNAISKQKSAPPCHHHESTAPSTLTPRGSAPSPPVFPAQLLLTASGGFQSTVDRKDKIDALRRQEEWERMSSARIEG
jgi:uncharacterized protein DUF4136